jgi:CHASE3 domain sensor protein
LRRVIKPDFANKNITSQRKPLWEGERSTIDIQALQKAQEQFDGFIKEMLTAKVLLAGLEIGGDDAYYEEYAKAANETGEIE